MEEDNNKKNQGESGHHGHPHRPIDDVSEETYSWWKKNYVLIKKTRIKTWRGVFVLAFIIGAAVALIWTISTNIHQFLKAEGETATMKLSVSAEPIIVGSEFAVDITLDSESEVVAARAIVEYSAEDMELVGCSTANSAFFVSEESCLATRAESFRIVNNDSPGIFDITVAKPTPGTSSTGLVVARLTFRALRVTTSPSSINLAFNHVSGQENYTDSDVILNDRKGTDILNTATGVLVTIGSAICNDWTPSDWSVCQSGNMFEGFDGYRTRTIVQSLPENCVGGTPTIPLVEGCDYVPPVNPVCVPTSYGYSDWSACQVTNIRTRTVTASAPPGCDQSNAVTLETCQYVDPSDPKVIGGEDIDIDDPKIKVGEGDRVKLKKDKKFYSKEKKFSFKGKISGLEGGSIKAYVDGDLDEEVKLNSKGEWKYSKKGKEGKTYKVKFVYFNSKAQEVEDSAKYEIKVDTKGPEFTDLPLALNKRAGSKIWWKAEDNNGIDHFTVEFSGKKKETKDASFIIPANTPRGMHWMVVKAFDKAGNTEIRRVLIKVR